MLPLDKNNILFTDYANWIMEHKRIIDQFQDNESLIIEYFKPVYKVIDYIYNHAINHTVNEEMMDIFGIGFDYLAYHFEFIRMYYETHFESNCDLLRAYADVIIYLVLIADIQRELDNNDIEYRVEFFEEIEADLDNMIEERNQSFYMYKQDYDKKIEVFLNSFGIDYETIPSVFFEIGESMGIIDLFEDEINLGE
jgi:hypothetical protein